MDAEKVKTRNIKVRISEELHAALADKGNVSKVIRDALEKRIQNWKKWESLEAERKSQRDALIEHTKQIRALGVLLNQFAPLLHQDGAKGLPIDFLIEKVDQGVNHIKEANQLLTECLKTN